MAIRYGFRRRGEGDDDADFTADDVLEMLTDDFLAHGDLELALERLLREGFVTPDGERVLGMEDLFDLAEVKEEEYEEAGGDDGPLAPYRERFDHIEELESDSLQELLQEALSSGDERRADVTKELVDERRLERSLMSERLDERISNYRNYEFVSSEAREEYEQLMSDLAAEAVNSYMDFAREMLSNPDSADMQRMRSMMDALSTMLEQDQAGEPLNPSFDDFMSQYGDYFPGAENLDDILAMLQERMAAANAMFNALSPEQRAELQGLFQQSMQFMEMDMSFQRLLDNVRQRGEMGTSGFGDRGDSLLSRMADHRQIGAELRNLKDMLRSGRNAIWEVDLDQVRRLLGDDAAKHVERLRKADAALKDGGYATSERGRVTLSAKGLRQIGNNALREIFAQLRDSTLQGAHRVPTVSRGGDREETSTAWEPGQPVNLHLGKTLKNAVLREGPGTPVRLRPEDFEVEEYESTKRAATVLCVDLSLSMEIRDNLGPAKKLALALTALTRSRFPRDYLAVVGFARRAHEVKLDDVAILQVEYDYGTNLQHALALSRNLLSRQRGEKQIIVVTDGEPTAYLDEYGNAPFIYPPTSEVTVPTMAEVMRCTKAGITINTFALDMERTQFPFVEQVARVNHGRTFYVDPDNLGVHVLDSYVRRRVS